MKIAHTYENFYTLSFAPGEDVATGLYEFVRSKDIRAGHISGLGATKELEFAYYNVEKKEYIKKEFIENVEILSLTGNIAVGEDGKQIVHIHGVFGREDFSVLGGHVLKLIISGAGEIHITTFPGEIRKKHDKDTGLMLMRSDDSGQKD